MGIVQSLSLKIADIDRAGFLDGSVLGETVHPRNFNTLRRISEEDGSVIEEEEQFTELASSEFLMQQLKTLMDAGGKEMLDSLPASTPVWRRLEPREYFFISKRRLKKAANFTFGSILTSGTRRLSTTGTLSPT